MKKPELTARELERLYFRLSRIDEEIRGMMKFIDDKYVRITAFENEENSKKNDN